MRTTSMIMLIILAAMFLNFVLSVIGLTQALADFVAGLSLSPMQTMLVLIAVLLVIVFSIMTAMGLAGWLGIQLTPISASAPTVIMTLAVADSVHVLVVALMRLREGAGKIEAMKESLRVNMQPVFLTTFTTAIGFLSLNFGEIPPFGDLGNITAIGVTAAFIFSVAFLPAFIAVVPLRVKVRPKSAGTSLMDRFANFAIMQRRGLLMGGVMIFIVLAAFIPRLENNEQWVDYFSTSMKFRQDSDFTQNNLTGLYSVEYSLAAQESGGISDPAYLQKLDNYAEWLRDQPEVYHVFSFTDTMRRLNKNMHADDASYYRVPDSRDLAAQYLLLYEMSLPYGLDLNDRVNVDKSSTRMTVTLNNMPTAQMLAFEDRAAQWQAENLPVHMHSLPSGPTAMFSHMAGQNVPALVGGAFLALGIITITMILALRSVKFGLLTIIPNLVPAVMTFGLWAIAVTMVDIAAATVIATTLGIVVDDSVHFMSKYMRSLRSEGGTTEGAVRYAFRTVAAALVTTSVVLSCGFAVLMLSTFRVNSVTATLIVVTLFFALLIDFLLLPALLIYLDRRRAEPAVTATPAFQR